MPGLERLTIQEYPIVPRLEGSRACSSYRQLSEKNSGVSDLAGLYHQGPIEELARPLGMGREGPSPATRDRQRNCFGTM